MHGHLLLAKTELFPIQNLRLAFSLQKLSCDSPDVSLVYEDGKYLQRRTRLSWRRRVLRKWALLHLYWEERLRRYGFPRSGKSPIYGPKILVWGETLGDGCRVRRVLAARTLLLSALSAGLVPSSPKITTNNFKPFTRIPYLITFHSQSWLILIYQD